MTSSKPDHLQRLSTRMTELEELFSHLERTVGDLDAGVRQCHQRLDGLTLRVDGLAAGLKTATDSIQENRGLEDDRPPHY